MRRAFYRSLLTLFLIQVIAPAVSAQIFLPLYQEQLPCSGKEQAADSTAADDRIGLKVLRVNTPGLYHYAPVPAFSAGSAIIIAPGGGYGMQASEWEGGAFARLLTSSGVHVFVLRYRLPIHEEDEHCRARVALLDATNAVKLLRGRAEELGIDEHKIAMMGFSAGGHLAGATAIYGDHLPWSATDDEEKISGRPDLSVLLYPVTIMGESDRKHKGSTVNLLGKDYLQNQLLSAYDLPARVHRQVPPTIIFHAADDAVVPVDNALRYYEGLVNNQVPAALHIYPAGGHGFSLGRHLSGSVKNWTNTLFDWLAEYDFIK